MSVMSMARDERADLAEFLAGLPPQQWDTPTLCTKWTVREVVAHMISYDHLGGRELLGRFAQGRFVLSRMNAVGVTEARDRSPHELLDLLDQHLEPRGLTSAFGGRVALLDGLVHHQDIRRPLGMARSVPPERLLPALQFARFAPPIGAFWRARGLRLVASDLGWSAGSGPTVEGPGEPLLMAIAGRRGVVSELAGPGRAILAARIEG
jgi:uncharacterized protein (TIGR03083 family)